MYADVLSPYDHALRTREPLRLWHDDGRVMTLELDRWLLPADAADRTTLDRTGGPTLDVGCGPGRMLVALHQQRRACLGVDISSAAVDLVHRHGLPALHRSVFDPLPREGRWSTVLLLDGNIGIGGDPDRLLDRVRTLLSPTGAAVVEVQPVDIDDRPAVRFAHSGAPIGRHFRWAHVGAAAVHRYARAVGLAVAAEWTHDGRAFALLRRTHQVAT